MVRHSQSNATKKSDARCKNGQHIFVLNAFHPTAKVGIPTSTTTAQQPKLLFTEANQPDLRVAPQALSITGEPVWAGLLTFYNIREHPGYSCHSAG